VPFKCDRVVFINGVIKKKQIKKGIYSHEQFNV
jgi:hypothetical protein